MPDSNFFVTGQDTTGEARRMGSLALFVLGLGVLPIVLGVVPAPQLSGRSGVLFAAGGGIGTLVTVATDASERYRRCWSRFRNRFLLLLGIVALVAGVLRSGFLSSTDVFVLTVGGVLAGAAIRIAAVDW